MASESVIEIYGPEFANIKNGACKALVCDESQARTGSVITLREMSDDWEPTGQTLQVRVTHVIAWEYVVRVFRETDH